MNLDFAISVFNNAIRSAGFVLALGGFWLVGANAKPVLIPQRADSCVIMDVDHARATGGDLLTWDFDLRHPGAYVVQLISPPTEAYGESTAQVETGTVRLNGPLEKVYLIEEGLVSQLAAPINYGAAGNQTLSLRTDLAVTQVRLVPQGYVNSRISISSRHYYDQWLKMHESPAKRAAMAWYQQARFGMFIHWGVYAEAAGSWKGTPIEQGDGPKVAEWIMFAFKISRQEYREYAKHFKPDKSFAANIACLAKETGMKYVVITAKHHDGFGLFDSAHSDFDIADSTAYQGDLIKELYEACRAEGLEFGVYYSHGNDWSEGGDGNFANVKQVNDAYGVPTRPQGKNLWDPSPNSHAEYLERKAYPQVAELIGLLPDLRLIWFDGEGLITEAQAFRFYQMVYELNPNIIVNRRVGYDFGDYVDAGDNKTPTESELAAKHFETCGTANHSWGFKAQDHAWKSSNELLRKFVDIVSKGGNYLLNIGPDGKGHVPEPCQQRFLEMGEWVRTNADAVFGTSRWHTYHEGVSRSDAGMSRPNEFWFSAKDNKVYAMALAQAPHSVRIGALKKSAGTITGVRLLGSQVKLKWIQTAEALEVGFGEVATSANGYALEVTLK